MKCMDVEESILSSPKSLIVTFITKYNADLHNIYVDYT